MRQLNPDQTSTLVILALLLCGVTCAAIIAYGTTIVDRTALQHGYIQQTSTDAQGHPSTIWVLPPGQPTRQPTDPKLER